MRSVLKVLFAVLVTVLFVMVGSTLRESVFDFIYFTDLESLFGLTAHLVAMLLFVIAFLLCVFTGQGKDHADPWSSKKKENGWAAYAGFTGGTFALVLAGYFIDSYRFGSFTFLMVALCVLSIVFGYAIAIVAIGELSNYEGAVTAEDLEEAISNKTDDYLRVEDGRVSYRMYDGSKIEVTINIPSNEPEKVVLDFDPDVTWYTVSGRTVKLYTYGEWTIVLFDKSQEVRVYESVVHTNEDL